jgi:hypothetical protein
VGVELALYLKREESYDLPVYDGQQVRKEEYLHLFTREPDVDISIGIGACCFRFEPWANRDPCHCLEWAWIHPYERAKGIMSDAWPEFVKRYGGFVVYPPISRGMKALLKKMGHEQGNESLASPCAGPNGLGCPANC